MGINKINDNVRKRDGNGWASAHNVENETSATLKQNPSGWRVEGGGKTLRNLNDREVTEVGKSGIN